MKDVHYGPGYGLTIGLLVYSFAGIAHELRNEMEGTLSRVLEAEAYAELDVVTL